MAKYRIKDQNNDEIVKFELTTDTDMEDIELKLDDQFIFYIDSGTHESDTPGRIIRTHSSFDDSLAMIKIGEYLCEYLLVFER